MVVLVQILRVGQQSSHPHTRTAGAKEINKERYQYWISQGAQASDTILELVS